MLRTATGPAWTFPSEMTQQCLSCNMCQVPSSGGGGGEAECAVEATKRGHSLEAKAGWRPAPYMQQPMCVCAQNCSFNRGMSNETL